MIRITVEGPGETFGWITKLIADELFKAGAKVEVKDKYPGLGDEQRQLAGRSIEICTKHCPWGG